MAPEKKLGFLLLFIIASTIPARGEFISEARLIGVSKKIYDEIIRPVKGKKTIEATFRESSHGGTYREIGRSHARFLLKTDPDFMNNFNRVAGALLPADHSSRKSDLGHIKELAKGFFPEILEEIDGFAEAAGIDRDDAVRYLTLYGAGTGTRGRLFGNCSIFTVGRERSATGTPLVGRSYEWYVRYCDMNAVITHPAGGYSSMGSSHHFVGRLDGMNEHGLFIGIMASISIRKQRDGFLFPIIVRAVLDKAKNLDEAIAILGKAPHSDGINYCIADRSGNAAVVEVIPGRPHSIRRLEDDAAGVLTSTNHFQNRDTARRNAVIMPNSFERLHILRRLLGKKEEKIGPDDVARILASERPDGVFWKYHENGFGTLFSGVYDLEKGTWRVTVGGGMVKEYRIDTARGGAEKVTLENAPGKMTAVSRGGNLFDMATFNGFPPVDRDSFYFNARISYVATDFLMYPYADISGHYKLGLGTERTYGPHVDFSVFAQPSGLFFNCGATVAFNPLPLFSLEVTPFYYLGYARSVQDRFAFRKRKVSDMEKAAPIINPGLGEMEGSPGITINPVLSLGGILTLENRMTFYFFRNMIFHPIHNMLVKKSFVWSPTLTALVPFSRHFLFGVQGGGTVKMSLDKTDHYVGKKYNAFAGPILVFPTIVDRLNLAILGSYMVLRSDENNRFNVVVSLQTQI